ncbi:hypothetical protein C0992_012894 [Termitomyces sp. T32_za158]|nr:hypothetical protein C0992_012894 [Termitomyces sp. T32_za158]
MSSTSPRSCPLPQELIDYIVVELSGDWRSLEACCLTAKCFRKPSQKALFKTLTLYDGSLENTRLDDAMSSNTLLQTYVQTLRLRLSPKPKVMPVLRKFTSLRSLRIEAFVLCWMNIHSHLQQDILYLIQSRTLEQLIFQSLSGFPLGILRHCPQLKDLQFFSSDRPEVKPIDLLNDEEIVSFDFAHVVLPLTNCADRSSGSMCLDLSGLTNLRVIHITWFGSVSLSLHFAATMFDTVSKQNKLQEIKFIFDGTYYPSEPDYGSWMRLDGMFTESAHLKISHFLIIMTHSTEDDECKFTILERLPKLQSKGLVEVQCLPRPR